MTTSRVNFRTGLIVPAVTALDERGEIIEQDQRRLIRHCLQGGAAAIFSPGTTGEFLHLQNDQRIRLMDLTVDEIRSYGGKAEAWPVVNGKTPDQTLENLKTALAVGAHRIFIAPLAVADLNVQDVPPFFREAAAMARSKSVPICLYENPEISAHASCRLLPPLVLKPVCRIPGVTGVKISVDLEELKRLLRIVEEINERSVTAVYLGNEQGPFLLDLTTTLVQGVVAGTGNLLPQEWTDAWKACIRGDPQEKEAYRQAFEDLTGAACNKFISAIKWGLWKLGVLSGLAVKPATPRLTEEEGRRFTETVEEVKARLRKCRR
ncbi:MAG TPA: dihydrodipicolinate synthase family protein [Acidobacteriota bacterium]|jgi:4-hydroxy-tetrahydrodipicolinate synthase